MGFPGGAVVKNSPANAGDMGSSPGLGKIPHAAEQLSLCATTWACALEPASHKYWAPAPGARALQQEKPPGWEAGTPHEE